MKIRLLFLFLLAGLTSNVFANAEFYETSDPDQRQKVVFDFGNGDEWKSVASEVEGQDYGTKGSDDTWLLKGGEAYVYKDNGSDISSVTLHYRIYKDGTSPAFNDINLPWAADLGGGKQRWATTGSSIDIIAAVNSPGTWYVEFYYSAATNGTNCSNPIYFSNSGNNYKLHFTADSSFPVELTSFSGNLTKGGILIKWTTASEQNTKSHIVERSTTGKGDFVTIGKVDAAGNSAEKLEYSFMDENPLPLNYYRLQTSDMDGKFQLSKVIIIKNTATNGITNVYPVPTKTTITLDYRMSTGNDVTLSITDIDGKVMKTMLFNAQKGSNSQNIDIHELPSGVYFLHLNDGVNIHTSRIIKN